MVSPSPSHDSSSPAALSHATPVKISNSGPLLDQYQHEDYQATNLLHAIRSWNLERPTVHNEFDNLPISKGRTHFSYCNYSSKPSPLTTRLLGTYPSECEDTLGSSKKSPLISRILEPETSSIPYPQTNQTTVGESSTHNEYISGSLESRTGTSEIQFIKYVDLLDFSSDEQEINGSSRLGLMGKPTL